ncbi:uncharacterized protein LOC125473767 [Pyrus x bretschneideri]|uniref:uncharacterized protein LOC125473767 n=1 Tax=Pyrus x bretschneideri TaxID=225117 RepID=UPI00202E6974|nr:uncharacterized protein LOC125473767 [Pyrus x bretschneideri]
MDLRSTGVKLGVEAQEEALLANFQVRPILIDRVLEAQMNDEGIQELIRARNEGKKKDLRIRETDDMLIQENIMYVLNNVELKKEILNEVHISAYAMHPGEMEMGKYYNGFLYKFPRTRNGYDGVWVIVDRFTKSAHFIPVREKYSLSRLAELFILKIVKYHGVPFGDEWHHRLDLMEFAYNNSYHSRIGMLPFEVLYDKSCCTPLCWLEVGERVLVGPEIVDETTQNTQLSPWKGVVRFGKKDPSHVIPPQPLEINPDLTYEEEPVTILDWKDKVLRNKNVRLVKVLWMNHSVKEAT